MMQLTPVGAQTEKYTNYPVYLGDDLGLGYSPGQSVFRIWAPAANQAQLFLYQEGTGGDPLETISMIKDKSGTWVVSVQGDWKGKFYSFRVQIRDRWMEEVPDPYAKCVGINGNRAMVVDLSDTNPPGWEKDRSPVFTNKTDAIIYELHIRDASIHPHSGILHKGKYLGLTEKGTLNAEGLSTGLDHLKELGVTHIHLLPFYDFFILDETKPGRSQYNWGYDPQNYNVPEGTYSLDPSDATSRIRELKELIRVFHDNGLRVIMDVTYNHTTETGRTCFEQLVPGYYYRHHTDGNLSNASGCGNETASERAMMRKFMLESVLYWVREYHVDGFRFDLMGVHDMTTMNLLSKELHRLRPDILLYGEGWTSGVSPLPDSLRALKANVSHLDRIAVFSDEIRDGIKGNVFDFADKGFVSGKPGLEESIKFGVVASCTHPQVDYTLVNYSKAPYAAQPWQTITYCECHDNHVLWDKLVIAAADASEEERKEMYRLALSIVLTSQGIPFLHAGSEFFRTKMGNYNSFNAGDGINALNWQLKTIHYDLFTYIRQLIRMRKKHPAFRMRTTEQIQKNIRFDKDMPGGIVGYVIDGAAMFDSWRKIRIYYNGNGFAQSVALEARNWQLAVSGNRIAMGEKIENMVLLAPYSCTILYLQIP